MNTKLYKVTFHFGHPRFEYGSSVLEVASRVRGTDEVLMGVQLWDDSTDFESMSAAERMAHKEYERGQS